MKRLLPLIVLVCMVSVTPLYAEESENGVPNVYQFPDIAPSIDISLGYVFLDFDGSRRAEEYRHPGDSLAAAADIRYLPFPHRLHLELDFDDSHDYYTDLSYAYRDLVLFRGIHRSLFHNLTNIYLGESPSVGNTDVRDRNSQYHLNIGITDAMIRFKAPDFPLHLTIRGHQATKEGNIQQRFLSGSAYFFGPTGGRVRASTKRDIDWKTTEYSASLNSHLGPVEAEFRHSQKQLDVNGDRILYDSYGQAGFVIRPAGTYPHNLVPETKGYTNTIKLHTMYTGRVVGSATFSQKHRENEESSVEVDHFTGAGSIVYMPAPALTLFLKYRHMKKDEDTPSAPPSYVTWNTSVSREAISSSTDTASLTVRYRPFSRLTLKAAYTFDRHRRKGYEDWHLENRTTKNRFTISADTRLASSLKASASYSHLSVDDPAYNVTPDSSDEGRINFSWTPHPRINTFIHYYIAREKRDHLHFVGFSGPAESPSGRDTKKDNIMASVTVLPANDLSVTGSYAFFRYHTEQDMMYHTSPPPSNDFWDEGVSGSMEAQVYAASLIYRWNDRLDLSGGVTHTLSRGDFDPSAADITRPVSISAFSVLKVRETIYTISGDYSLPAGFRVGVEYRYSDFDDRIDDPYDDIEDGTAQMIWVRLSKRWS